MLYSGYVLSNPYHHGIRGAMPERQREPVSEPVKSLCVLCEPTDPPSHAAPSAPTDMPGALSSAHAAATPAHVPCDVSESVTEPQRTGEPVPEPQRDAQRVPEPQRTG